MGCGASSIYAKDGTIAAGKGEAGFACDTVSVTNVFIWAGKDDDKVKLQLRDIPEDIKLLKDAKFVDQGSEIGQLCPMTLNHKAGLRQARWIHTTADGPAAKKYPAFCDLALPQTMFAAHKVDEKKHPANLVKAGKQKDKEHPYVKDEEKALKDLEACEKFASPSQMHDDMNIYKDSLATIEDTVVQSQANTFASITTKLGFLAAKDGELQMGIPEKAQKAIEDKKNCDAGMQGNLMKAVDAKNTATTAVYKGAVVGASKALGVEPEQLCPGIDGMLAQSLGVKPFTEPYDKIKTFTDKGVALPTPEEYTEQQDARNKELLESDKTNEDGIRKAEAGGEFVKEFEEKIKKMMEHAVNVCQPLAKGDITEGKRVLARWCKEGQCFGFQEGVVSSAVSSQVWYEKADAKPEPIKKEGECALVKFDDGDECLVPIEHIAAECTDVAKEEDLVPGYLVRAKFFGDCYLDGVIAGPKNKDGFPVFFDAVFTPNVKIEDIRPAHDVDKIASFPHTLYRQANDLTVFWIDGNESLKVEANVWREGDDGNVTTVELKSVKNKKKDANGNETGEDVHGGYKASISLLQGRAYRYNFKVTPEGGEAAYFVDFGKGCEESGSKGMSYAVTC